jgi:hypothetical protein
MLSVATVGLDRGVSDESRWGKILEARRRKGIDSGACDIQSRGANG